MPDPLDTIMRLRRVTVDDAKRELGVSLRAEEEAEAKAKAAEALIGEEAHAAADLSAGDAAVEAFAAWLPVGLSNAAAAQVEYEERRAKVALTRAALSMARAAADVVQNMLDRRAAERAVATSRREQAKLDDMTVRRHSRDET
jgi:flagellar FliJ protein